MAQTPRNRVFISYSHRDRKYLERLHIHLAPYEREGLIDYWDDTKLESGADWRQEIRSAVNSAKVAILLVSADFLASRFRFIAANELPPLLVAAENAGVKIFSVVLAPCSFERTAFARYQAVHDPSKPLGGLSRNAKEKVWARLTELVSQELAGPQLPPHSTSPHRPDIALPYPSVFSVASMKGGSGKTVSTINIAASLSEMACRTLVIDLDPQQSIAQHFGLRGNDSLPTLSDHIVDGNIPPQEILQAEVRPHLSLLPGGPNLATREDKLKAISKPDCWLSTVIASMTKSHLVYDFILIDCPPYAGPITRNAYVASHGIMIPVMCDHGHFLEGVSRTMSLMEEVNNLYTMSLNVFGIIPIGYEPLSEFSVSTASLLRNRFPSYVFSTNIPPIPFGFHGEKYARTLLEFDVDSPCAQAYKKLTREVVAKSYQIRMSHN